MRRILISLLLLVSSMVLFSQEAYFLSYPSLSPDGKTVLFSFEGDIWKADVASGEATRLTAMQGYETSASYSPDGNWIAFTGHQYGNADIFILPAKGGEVRPLTFHAANDEMEGWTWDSKEILFRSNRFNSSSVYQIPITGGNPTRLFDHFFNVVHNVAIHPVTGEIFFNDTWESLNMAWRKRYRGQYDPDIQSYNPKTGAYKLYTEWDGKDMWATIDRQGTVYFVSDQPDGEYNLFTLDNDKPKALTHFTTSIFHPSVAADGSSVAFEKDYQLWIYDAASGKTRKLNISIVRNTLLPMEQSFNVATKISNFDVSPDNKKIAFVSRGDLFVSDISGKFVRKIDRKGGQEGRRTGGQEGKAGEPKFERVKEVKWLKNNKTLLFNQTLGGYTNWYSIAADGSGKMKRLSNDKRNNRDLVLNKDRTMGAYLSGRDELRLMDLKDMKSKTIVTDEFWGFQNGSPCFSPDGKWLTYTAKRDFEDDIFVYNLESKKVINLTKTGVSESGVVWSGDGKYIYFVSNRLQPSYPTGAGDRHLYRLALDRFDKEYRTEEYDKMFVKKDSASRKKDSTAQMTISINPERTWERFERIGPSFGSQGTATLVEKGDKVTVLFTSNHDKGKTALWKTVLQPFEAPKTEKIEGLTGRPNPLVVGDKVYALSGGDIWKVNVDGKKGEKIKITYAFTRNPAEEFRQMFEETWSNMEENYYHENLHGENWKAFRTYYESFLPYLNDRGDLRTLLNELLGELNSSHMGFNTSGKEESTLLKYVSLEPGILFEEEHPYRVSRIVTRGPAERKDIDIREGDQLVKVDGMVVDPSVSRDYYFYRPAMVREMTLTFKRDQKEFSVNIHPMSGTSLRGQLYDEWIDGNHKMVEQLSDGKIAYAHMKNMGGGELNDFIMTMTRELKGKEGLILDLRYNTGGNVHDDLLRFLQQRTYLQWKSRGGKLTNQSNFAPSDHPIVVLINEQSLSDAEMTSAGFKALGLGTLIGTETYRWIIFTSSMGLVDGSSHRMPGWGCYTLDGKDLEKVGVQPDIEVKQTFVDRLNGKDPQIAAAVKAIIENR